MVTESQLRILRVVGKRDTGGWTPTGYNDPMLGGGEPTVVCGAGDASSIRRLFQKGLLKPIPSLGPYSCCLTPKGRIALRLAGYETQDGVLLSWSQKE